MPLLHRWRREYAPAPYFSLRKLLESQGHETHCPQPPSADLKQLLSDPTSPNFDQDPPPSGHPPQTQDSDVIKTLLKYLVEKDGKEVLLIAHSSGGWSASEAAVPEFQFQARQAEGKEGGIIRIFNIASFLIPVGQSVRSTFSGKPNEEPAPWFTLHVHQPTSDHYIPYVASYQRRASAFPFRLN